MHVHVVLISTVHVGRTDYILKSDDNIGEMVTMMVMINVCAYSYSVLYACVVGYNET